MEPDPQVKPKRRTTERHYHHVRKHSRRSSDKGNSGANENLKNEAKEKQGRQSSTFNSGSENRRRSSSKDRRRSSSKSRRRHSGSKEKEADALLMNQKETTKKEGEELKASTTPPQQLLFPSENYQQGIHQSSKDQIKKRDPELILIPNLPDKKEQGQNTENAPKTPPESTKGDRRSKGRRRSSARRHSKGKESSPETKTLNTPPNTNTSKHVGAPQLIAVKRSEKDDSGNHKEQFFFLWPDATDEQIASANKLGGPIFIRNEHEMQLALAFRQDLEERGSLKKFSDSRSCDKITAISGLKQCVDCRMGVYKRKVTTAGYLAAILLFPLGTCACLGKVCCAIDACTYCGHLKPDEKTEKVLKKEKEKMEKQEKMGKTKTMEKEKMEKMERTEKMETMMKSEMETDKK